MGNKKELRKISQILMKGAADLWEFDGESIDEVVMCFQELSERYGPDAIVRVTAVDGPLGPQIDIVTCRFESQKEQKAPRALHLPF